MWHPTNSMLLLKTTSGPKTTSLPISVPVLTSGGRCILTIIAKDTPALRAVNPPASIKQTDYREQEFRPSLSAFTAQRTGLLAVLEPLSSKGWSRKAMVTGAGKILERTVPFHADWLVRHKRPHVKQIERIINTMQTKQ